MLFVFLDGGNSSHFVFNCWQQINFYYYILKKNVDGAMHFIYSHKYNTNLAEDSSDMN